MAEEIKMPTGTSYPVSDEITDKDKTGRKKRSGCGCFLVGCGVIVAVIALLSGTGFYLIASMDEADYGELAVRFVKSETVSSIVREGIRESGELSAEEKTLYTEVFDKLLANYDNLSAEDHEAVNRRLGVIIREVITNPEKVEQAPPPELFEILKILGVGDVSPSDPPGETVIPPTQPSPQPSGDPYSFDIPSDTTAPADRGEGDGEKFDF